MKIAVNTRLLLKNKLEGIGWFTCESLKRITQAHPEHTFYFIFDRPFDESFIFSDNVIPIITFPPPRHPYLIHFYFAYSIPYVLRKIKADLFLSPDGWLSLKTNIPQIAVIHDINFEHHPEFFKPVVLDSYTGHFPKFAQKALRIATVSEFSKQDIHQKYNVPIDKIDVVYNGSNAHFTPLTIDEKIRVRARYANGCDYFLFVSAIHKRKNLSNILRAFDAFKTETGSDVKFVVVGTQAGLQGDIQTVYNQMKFKDEVYFLGHLSSKILSEVTASALALVYTPLFEGFGIPIVEAFNAETAVITSNVTSMPEVAGDAALLVNPLKMNEIKEAMAKLAADEIFRQSLIEKGRIQRSKFSWQQTADKLWNCVETAMQNL